MKQLSAAILVVLSPFAFGENASLPLAKSLWVPRTALLDAGREARLPAYCEGAYVERDYPWPVGVDSATLPIRARAERLEYLAGDRTEFQGNVTIDQGNRRFTTDRVVIEERSRRAELAWGVVLSEPGVALTGESAWFDLDGENARLENAEFLLFGPELRGEADVVEQSSGTLTMQRARFTRCEPGSNTWEVSSGRFTVAQGEVFGRARNAAIKIRGVPIFYTPYMRVPVTDARQSGLLFPNLGYSEDGVDMEVPYYLNLAPDYDATLTPRYISNRGTSLEVELRHKSRSTDTIFGGAYLADDDLYNGELGRDDFEMLEPTGRFVPTDRWLGSIDHRGRRGNVTTFVDYAATSDVDFFRDLGTDLAVASQDHLRRRGEVQYTNGGLFARVWSQAFQVLDDRAEPYRRLPEVNLSYAGDFVGPLGWALGATWTSFDRPNDAFSGIASAVGNRTHIEPRLQLAMSRSWGSVNLGGGYRYTSYDLNDVPSSIDATPDRGIAFADIDAGLFFERDLVVAEQALIQTLEPRLYYLYQNFEEQRSLPRFDTSELAFSFAQIFRENRFSGLDRIGDANQLGVGLTSRFLQPQTGNEYVRVSLGTIVYFQDRRVTLSGAPTDTDMHSTSEVVAEIVARLGRAWAVSSNVTWDPMGAEEEEIGFSLQYRRDNRQIFNLGHRKRRSERIDQSNMAFIWPINRHWSAMGRWNYDFEIDRTNEVFFGFEYASCCWQVRVLYRRFAESAGSARVEEPEDDEAVLLQFVFRGLAGFGTRVESLLSRGIKGYREETAIER